MEQQSNNSPPPDAPDLQTQLEDILHAVWLAEASWRFDDRIELATRRRRANGWETDRRV